MPPKILDSPQALKDLIGKELAPTEWFTVTQERINKFAEATEDRQWIHLDEARAKKESPFGATIAHGFLTLSLTSHFMKEAIQVRSGVRLAVNYGLNKVRFPAPVKAGAKIRAKVKVQSVKELPDCVEAIFEVTIEAENARKPSCAAECIVRYYF
jgi:acyl dehydratase